MTTNDETKQVDEPEQPTPPEAEAPRVEDPEEVRAAARDALSALRENPTALEALQNLATISELVRDPALETDLVAAAQAVVLATLAAPQLPAGTHAHLTVLFSHLLALRSERDAVDALYASWIRHLDAFGGGHATPASFQQEVFVQRVGDLLGWGLLDGTADNDGVARFAEWIDSWNPRSKFRVRRVIDMLHRNFPAGGAWRAVRFPSGEGHRPRHDGPRQQTRPQGADDAQPQAADDAQPQAPDDAQPQAPDDATRTTSPEGTRRRRRRGGRKNRGRREGAAPQGADGGDDVGNLKAPEAPVDDDDDDTQPPGI